MLSLAAYQFANDAILIFDAHLRNLRVITTPKKICNTDSAISNSAKTLLLECAV